MTKLILFRSFAICLILCTFLQSLDAQRSRKSRRPVQEETSLVDKLWYGGGFALGFYGGSLSGAQSSEFFIGVSPMVGYKVTENLSFGPRMEVALLTGRYDFGRGDVQKITAVNYGAGLFGRLKFFNILFGHIEYGYLNQAFPVLTNDGLGTERVGSDQFLIGLGYNSGYPFGSEIYIVYDLLAPEDTVDLPITFRFGFTYLF